MHILSGLGNLRDLCSSRMSSSESHCDAIEVDEGRGEL